MFLLESYNKFKETQDKFQDLLHLEHYENIAYDYDKSICFYGVPHKARLSPEDCNLISRNGFEEAYLFHHDGSFILYDLIDGISEEYLQIADSFLDHLDEI